MPAALCVRQFDNKMDRRECLNILDRLPPIKRMKWLEWCCKRSSVGGTKIKPEIRKDMWERMQVANVDDIASEKLSIEIFFDVWSLALQYGMDLHEAFVKLEEIARYHR